ncbi:glucose-1-phosphate adenylyltransferase [soil metagenome]
MDPIDIAQVKDRTLAIIMGGGAGTRLFPLTKDRSKPAVPLGGKYRLVDIPISNCINSGINHVYVLTQYNSASLNQHISAAYKFDHFSNGFVEVLAAQQTNEGAQWYQGTADAVRQNIRHFQNKPYEYVIILSGDQLYRMDYRKILFQHITRRADVTIATLPVTREDAKSFGIMHTDADSRITRFEEKPQDDDLLDSLRMPAPEIAKLGLDLSEERFQASMGIYVFNRDTLETSLDNNLVDFGKHIIPAAIKNLNVFGYVFPGYWEDIGTIKSFFDANLELAHVEPSFDFYDRKAQIFTNARFLPASKINSARIDRAIVSDGCILSEVEISNAIIGIRSVIERGTVIRDAVIMGADYYEEDSIRPAPDLPHIGIGQDCYIERAIIDKNTRIGHRVRITPEGKSEDLDAENYYVRDGIVCIPKGAVIPDDSVI